MIDYQTYCQIQDMVHTQKLSITQVARHLQLAYMTVARWAKEKRYTQRQPRTLSSKLDPYRQTIRSLLSRYPYTAVQIFQMIGEDGYDGGYTLVKEFVRSIRPPKKEAYLSLSFEVAEAAQVDFGYCGTISIGNAIRRLSVFVMVLCYSRMIYLEFTLKEGLEHFFCAHNHAFRFFGGVPRKIIVDNAKVAVLKHTQYGEVVFHPRYNDLAAHYGCSLSACTPRSPHQKGRVESGIKFVKTNLINGLELSSLGAVQTAGNQWRDDVANCRDHRTTNQRPIDLFKEEKSLLIPLAKAPYDGAIVKRLIANKQFQFSFDSNRYSVPAKYASTKLSGYIYPERIGVYHNHKLIATHLRSYDKHQTILNPDHQRELLSQRKSAREQRLLKDFYAIGRAAEKYYEKLQQRRLHTRSHVRKIMALTEIYSPDKVHTAIEDAIEFNAIGSDYIANILEQRARLPSSKPGALHLLRKEDLLDMTIEEPDMNFYTIDQPSDNKQRKDKYEK